MTVLTVSESLQIITLPCILLFTLKMRPRYDIILLPFSCRGRALLFPFSADLWAIASFWSVGSTFLGVCFCLEIWRLAACALSILVWISCFVRGIRQSNIQQRAITENKMFLCVYICVYIYIYIYMSLCVCVCMCVCVCVYVCVCVISSYTDRLSLCPVTQDLLSSTVWSPTTPFLTSLVLPSC